MTGVTTATSGLSADHEPVLVQIIDLYRDLFLHNGYGALRVEMRFLKRGQKEIFVICGKEYRFVVDYPGERGTDKEVRTT
ncbi:MAG: hypothetical protein A4E57_00326 [Syntrophorhabdaceae bacterium PtaU1.Bin034]|jgi:hypothetical protein|nr:MAG: hypothetical protein A4E57_00326 [Syntrophorhabdaceae bacterium PtaU1.Bin034]